MPGPAPRGPTSAPSTPIRLLYLDGVRGLAVLLVVVTHLYLRIVDPKGSGLRLHGLARLALTGRLAVAAFIVLSGYSLMIPVARSADGRLAGGLRRYARRRARRILPPYYAALTLSLLPLLPAVAGWPRLPWQPLGRRHPDLSVGSVIAHLLLVHNLSPTWARQINGPLWSLGTEWQIYVLFPLLLALCRRAGAEITAVAACAVGLALGTLRWPPLAQASPWYLGLFAIGMLGCTINFGSAPRYAALRRTIPWKPLAMLLAMIVIALMLFDAGCVPLLDIVGGLAIAVGLVARTQHDRSLQATAARRWFRPPLESAWAVRLGVVSYSLYLIHQPLITIADTLVSNLARLGGERRAIATTVVSIAAMVSATAIFHHLFERPFMAGRPKTEHQAAISAALEPGF